MSEAVKAGASAPVEAPFYPIANFSVMVSGTEIVLLANRLIPMIGAEGPHGVAPSTSAVLHMSPQTAKELHLLLSGVVGDYEVQFGKLRSPFIDEREKK